MLVDKEHEQEINWLCKPTESFRHLSLLQHSLAYPDYVICVVQRKMKIQRPLLKKNYSTFQDGHSRALNHVGFL